jgi:HAMP domain-containing protein
MLRRKLLTILFSVTALLMALAVLALWAMYDVHAELNHLAWPQTVNAQRADQLSLTLSRVEVELYALQAGRQRRLDNLIDAVEQMRDLSGELSAGLLAAGQQPMAAHLAETLAVFERRVGSLAVTRDPALLPDNNRATMAAATDVRQQVLTIKAHLHDEVQWRMTHLSNRFHRLVIGMAVGFVLVINVSIVLLLRSAEMVVRPVELLVEASRQLGRERFEHRVDLASRDEFQELATAFNHLAQQLQDNEQRKLEVTRQIAVTLNHELNNAMAIIDLQLRLLRRAGDERTVQQPLEQIHHSLQRMAGVVKSLNHVRRIVLTDYMQGTKMLDLEQSVCDSPPAAGDVGPRKAAWGTGDGQVEGRH